MSKFLNSIGRCALTILVIILVLYGWIFLETKIMLKSYPEMFGYIFYQQLDEDMLPDFNQDDIIIVKKDSTYNVGDRVMYLDENSEYKIHTVVYTDSISTTTKCDMCEKNDRPVDNSAIIGRAVGKILFFGRFINFFKQKWFIITLAVVGFVFIIIGQYLYETPKKIS